MRNPVSQISLILAATAVFSLSSTAQESRLQEAFDRFDKNKDGKVTAEELGQPALFKLLDADGDGAVSMAEARKHFAKPRTPEPKPDPSLEAKTAPASTPPTTEIRQGPKPLAPSAEGIGRLVSDCEFRDINGQSHRLSEFKDKRALVIAVTSTSCPLSKKYLPTLAKLEVDHRDRSVAFLYVNPTETDQPAAIQAAVKDNGLRGIYVHDSESKLLTGLGAKTTTECFVLDASRTLIYRGAVDDQYGFGYAIDAPRQSYLAKAIDATLNNRSLDFAATTAPGCELDLGQSKDNQPAGEVTYHAQIARIMQTHCVECHHDGGVAPFALTSAKDVMAHAPMIRQVIERGVMPPWFAAKPERDHAPHWLNDRSLPESDKSALFAWLASDRPLGDPAEAPLPRDFSSGWMIGKPDAVFEFAKPVAIKATGVMSYQDIVVDTGLTEDKWVQAIEIRPSAPGVVHHVLVFALQDGQRRGDGDEEGRGGFWAAYVPGNRSRIFPEGFGKKLPQGSKLRFQMHYTPNGTATEDKTAIGLVYAQQPPQHEIRVAGIVNPKLSIPPGADNHREVATLRLPFDVEVLGFMPHMHLRGKACRYQVEAADQQSRLLLDIPRYDFNWQLMYRPTEPIALSRGQTMHFTAWFDNSKNNPANPDPTKTVRWGNQTFDEMHLGYIEYVQPGVEAGTRGAKQQPAELGGRVGDAMFESVDADKDGFLSRQELDDVRDKYPRLKENPKLIDLMFKSLDADANGKLDRAELTKLRDVLQR